MSVRTLRRFAVALSFTLCAVGAVQAGEKFGIPACDSYFAKVETCVTNKMPEAARTQYRASMEQTRAAWQALAANPQAKAALENTCNQALQTMKQQLAAYSCEF